MTDYDLFLKDGTVLCSLMDKIKPGSMEGKVSADSNKERRQNIESFLNACLKVGVSREMLFKPEDLLFLRHIPRVTRCLFALGKKVSEDPKYKGPAIGNEPYEPVGKAGRRRGGLPLGDDIYVAHIKVDKIINMLPLEGREKSESSQNRISLYNF